MIADLYKNGVSLGLVEVTTEDDVRPALLWIPQGVSPTRFFLHRHGNVYDEITDRTAYVRAILSKAESDG